MCDHATRLEVGPFVWCFDCERHLVEPIEPSRPFAAAPGGLTFAEFLAARGRI